MYRAWACIQSVHCRQIWGSRDRHDCHHQTSPVAIATLVSTSGCPRVHQYTFKHTTMSSRSLGELLLRPSPLARTPLCQTSSIKRIAPSWTTQRSISNSPSQSAAQPRRKDDSSDSASQPKEPEPRQTPVRFTAPRQSSQNETSSAIDSLFGDMPNRRRPTTYAPRNLPQVTRCAPLVATTSLAPVLAFRLAGEIAPLQS
jgi:hypothetical protein